jgi:hypothetical protein
MQADFMLLSSIFRALSHFVLRGLLRSGGLWSSLRGTAVRWWTRPPFGIKDLAAVLKLSGVATPAEIDARWRGDESAINSLMSAFDAPANSDYQPYVDIHAARARFLRSNAESLFETQAPPCCCSARAAAVAGPDAACGRS